MATIGELFGQRIDGPPAEVPQAWLDRHCPFTNRMCDVSSNRSDRATLDLAQPNVAPEDAVGIRRVYGEGAIPLGICSVLTKRQNERVARPWIVCPKRMLELRTVPPVIPPSVRELIPIQPGTPVRCWWEFKFRARAEQQAEALPLDADVDGQEGDEEIGAIADSSFFEYTFDYLIVPVERQLGEAHPRLVGPPYVLEVMTSSTRGGGLTEHMVDVLRMREQTSLRGRVKSPYTPNYRQVFERMLGQFFAKSEIAEQWGGRAIWLVQDVLVDYIEQSTDFRADRYPQNNDGNVFVAVFRMHDTEDGQYELRCDRTLRGRSRPRAEGNPDFTTMLGLGHAPPLAELFDVLTRSQSRPRRDRPPNWIDFDW